MVMPHAMQRRFQPQLEVLETRRVLSGSLPVNPNPGGVIPGVEVPIDPLGHNRIHFDDSTGVISITGDDGFNFATVDDHDFPIHHIYHGQSGVIVVLDNDGAGSHEVSATYLRANVEQVVFNGLDGNDVFINTTDIPTEAHGDEGSDWLEGGSGDDELRGGKGDDTVLGNGGTDTLYGGPDNDLIEGNARADTVYGGKGDDTINGGNADDELHGGEGNDSISGGKGNDQMYGDPDTAEEGGMDTLLGEAGEDTLYGGLLGDRLEGGEDPDELWGEDGPDVILGGAGDDQAWGGQGGDILEGNNGSDTLRGGDGPDRVYGGGSDDELYGGPGKDGLWGAAGTDTLTGGDGADRFLMHEVKDEFDVITTIADVDVVVAFANGDEETLKGVTYAAAVWSDDEVIEVDAAFAEMVQRTGNNTLLRRKSGKELTFHRVGAVIDVRENIDDPFFAAGWNSNNGNITLADSTFISAEFTHQTVFHEIAHNWDDENDEWGDWKDLSGWQRGGLFGLGEWQHDADAVFARDYGETNPLEDFATSFAAVFMFDMGETYSGEGAISSLEEIEEKVDFIHAFLDGL